MTNFERWRSITDGFVSPDSYVNWSFYYMIAASLQRRVWFPPKHNPVYPNIFVNLVGPPGTGKNDPIKLVIDLFSEIYRDEANKPTEGLDAADTQTAQMLLDADTKKQTDIMVNGKNKLTMADRALSIPMAPNAVTFQALVLAMSNAICRKDYFEFDNKIQKRVLKIYTHSSLAFCLGEISSLFRKHQNELLNFLIQAYDCDEVYEYESITRGKDRIRRVCLNFLGGTTPAFIQSTFDDKLINEGYSSRTFFIYASKNRKSAFFRPEMNDEQKKHRAEISAHLRKLVNLYGQVEIDNETIEFLESWIKDFESNPKNRVSQSPKMGAYYARINKHVMKLAMALHFGETTEMKIPLETFKKAIEILQREERNMHYALITGGDNPLSKGTSDIVSYLRSHGAKGFVELLTVFWEKYKKKDLEEVLDFLQDTDQVSKFIMTDELGQEVVKYKHK